MLEEKLHNEQQKKSDWQVNFSGNAEFDRVGPPETLKLEN